MRRAAPWFSRVRLLNATPTKERNMIRQILVDFVVVLSIAAMFFVMDKVDKKQWSEGMVFPAMVGIYALGSGLIQLLTGHNPVIDSLIQLVTFGRHDLPTAIVAISLYLVFCLILAKTSPRFRQWLDETFPAENTAQTNDKDGGLNKCPEATTHRNVLSTSRIPSK
jgi:hypothetical protein